MKNKKFGTGKLLTTLLVPYALFTFAQSEAFASEIVNNNTEVVLVAEKTSDLSNTSVVDSEKLAELNENKQSVDSTLNAGANPLQSQSLSGNVGTLSKESNALINVQPVWNAGNKGEGTVVAVIDSGIDPEHDAFSLTSLENAKYKSAEEIEALKEKAGITYGKWVNDKIVYAYNYREASDNIKETKEASHGTHVSGIAVGNPKKEDVVGDKIYGVAPEAQLMFMRVFADGEGTSPVLYVKAIEDAVSLGADTINLSLGSAAGSLVDVGGALNKAIEDAKKKGVTVVIAAGNDTAWGNGQGNPLATNPDYGVVATPATAKDSIAVASINNTHLVKETFKVIGLEDSSLLTNGMSTYKQPDQGIAFKANSEFEYVYVGLGKEEDYKDKDLKGKIALIKRGEIPFYEKIIRAKDHNAAGVVVFNNVPTGDDVNMSLGSGQDAIKARMIPSVFISQSVGEALAAGQYKLLFNNLKGLFENPDAGYMSDFTSWGLSADGELKPDVTAPGGGIYSSINNGKYSSMQGTSMAAPHVAGAMALIQKDLREKYPNLTPEQIADLSKELLMSTAKAVYDKEKDAYVSPRQQGAGLIDLPATISSKIYLTGKDKYPSITLGNVEDQFSITVNVHNISNEDQKLKYVTNLITDEVEDGEFTLRPKALEEIVGEEIVVEANTVKTIKIAVDATKYAAELSKLMPNGYFLEGFVRFLDTVDGFDLASIPFTGFRGEFQNLAVTEKPIYDYTDTEQPFYSTPYFDITKDVTTTDPNTYFTALITNQAEFNHETGDFGRQSPIVLGSFNDGEDNFYIKKNENGKPVLAISPNGDGNRDVVAFQGVFLRNFTNLKATVYKADDTEFANPIWESETVSGEKNYYAGNSQKPRAHFFEGTAWEGKDKFNVDVPDGTYKYVVTYEPQVYGGKETRLEYEIEVNRKRPALTTAVTEETEEGYTFNPRETLAYGLPIYRERLYYVIPTKDELGNPIQIENPNLKDAEGNPQKETLTEARRIYIEPDENGVYLLPLVDEYTGRELTPVDFFYAAEDEAGNVTSGNVSEFMDLGNENGIVNIITVDKATGILYDTGYNFIIRNEAGEVVVPQTKMEKDGFTRILPFGKYTVELILIDKDEARIVDSQKIKSFEVTENNSLQEIEYLVEPIHQSQVTIDFMGTAPEGTEVYLVDANGDRVVVPNSRYSKETFSKLINEGEYKVEVVLPDGYVLLAENPTIDVKDLKVNSLQLEVAKKVVEVVPVPYETVYEEDENLLVGEEKVVTEGVEGQIERTTIKDKSTDVVLVEKVNKVVKVGVKSVRTEEIPFETVYEEDETLLEGEEKVATEGKVGVKEITLVKGQVTKEEVKEAPVAKVIKKGVKSVKTEEIPFETVYEEDETLLEGEEKVATEGKVGVKEITLVKGQVTKEEVKEAPVAKVIKKGVKSVKTEEIPFETVYEEDETLLDGKEEVATEGKVGVKEVTLVRGQVVKEEVKEAPVAKVIKKGTKAITANASENLVNGKPAATITTEKVPFEVIYKADDSLEFGQVVVDVEGVEGVVNVITIPTLQEDGTYKDVITRVTEVEKVDKVVRVGKKVLFPAGQVPKSQDLSPITTEVNNELATANNKPLEVTAISSSEQNNTTKSTKVLPNTGDTTTNTAFAGIITLLSSVLLYRRKTK